MEHLAWDNYKNVPRSQVAYCETCDKVMHIKHCCTYSGIGFDTSVFRNHQKWGMGKREHESYMIESAKRDGRQIMDEKGNIYGAGIKEYI